MIFSSLCMISLSPPLLQLPHERSPYQLDHPILINPNFSIPQLGFTELSYGSLLSIACLLVRIIQQVIHILKPHKPLYTKILVSDKT